MKVQGSLLKIELDEAGILVISRPPFQTVFSPEEVHEIKCFFEKYLIPPRQPIILAPGMHP